MTPAASTQLKIWLGRLETVALALGPLALLGVLGIYRTVADVVS